MARICQVLASKLLGDVGDKATTPAVGASGDDAKPQQQGDAEKRATPPAAEAAETAATGEGVAAPEHRGKITSTTAAPGSCAHPTGRGDGDVSCEGPEEGFRAPSRRNVVLGGAGRAGTGEDRGVGAEGAEAVRIVAVDLQEMAPIEGVKQLQVGRLLDDDSESEENVCCTF